eukprot:scaffold306874_cov24-Attheya_sp.AAC.1
MLLSPSMPEDDRCDENGNMDCLDKGVVVAVAMDACERDNFQTKKGSRAPAGAALLVRTNRDG